MTHAKARARWMPRSRTGLQGWSCRSTRALGMSKANLSEDPWTRPDSNPIVTHHTRTKACGHQTLCHPEHPRSGWRDLLMGHDRRPADPSSGFALVRDDRRFPDARFLSGSPRNASRCDEGADVAGFPGTAFGLTRAVALRRSPTASASTTGSAPCRRTTRSARADTPAARGAHRRWSPSGSGP